MYNIFTFFTVSEVLKFERVLNKEGVFVELMPVPRKLSTSCGTCAKTRASDEDLILELVKKNNLDYDEIYKVD